MKWILTFWFILDIIAFCFSLVIWGITFFVSYRTHLNIYTYTSCFQIFTICGTGKNPLSAFINLSLFLRRKMLSWSSLSFIKLLISSKFTTLITWPFEDIRRATLPFSQRLSLKCVLYAFFKPSLSYAPSLCVTCLHGCQINRCSDRMKS